MKAVELKPRRFARRVAADVSRSARQPLPGRDQPDCPTYPDYSHSMVPGGLLVTSSTTRFTSGTSLVIRVEMRSSTS